MREDAVEEFLRNAGAGWEIVDMLVESNELLWLEYGGNTFYLRRFGERGPW